MFDIGFSELMVIGVVALVVIGPERLPRVARTAGHLLGRFQRYVARGQVRHQPRDGARRAEEAADQRRGRRPRHRADGQERDEDSAEQELRSAETELRKAEEEDPQQAPRLRLPLCTWA